MLIKTTYRRQPTTDFALISKKRAPAQAYDDDEDDDDEELLAHRTKKWQKTTTTIALLAAACNAVALASIPQPISPPTVRKRLDWELEAEQLLNEGPIGLDGV